jgi:hypothetical protein
MVRQGDFELCLVQADGQPFPEVQHKGKAIAVAAPGRQFEVQVIRHNAAYASRQPHGPFLNVRLELIVITCHRGHACDAQSSVQRHRPPLCSMSPSLAAHRLHPVCRLS